MWFRRKRKQQIPEPCPLCQERRTSSVSMQVGRKVQTAWFCGTHLDALQEVTKPYFPDPWIDRFAFGSERRMLARLADPPSGAARAGTKRSRTKPAGGS